MQGVTRKAGMPVAGESSAIILFGEGRWDGSVRRLSVRGQVAKLPWRVAECLSVLLEAGGTVVTKEELQQQIWGSALVEESNLAQCITALRKALDPAPDGGSHIETVARVGYRLAVAVVEEAPAQSKEVDRRRKRGAAWLLVAVPLLAAAGSFAGFEFYKRAERRQRADALVERGLGLLRRGNLAQGSQAAQMFQQALDVIPEYAPATAALAESAARFGDVNAQPALVLARRAVEQDPNCGECQAVLGFVLGMRFWKWEEAGRHLARSMELEPISLQRRYFYTEWLIVQGRLEEAARQAEATIRLDPREPRAYTYLASVRYLQGRYREAIHEAARAEALDKLHSTASYWTYRSHLQMGDDANAILAHSKELGTYLDGGAPRIQELSERFIALLKKSGKRAVAQAWIDEVGDGVPRDVHRYNRAIWFMWMGEQDSALNELEAAVRSRPYHLIYVAVDPAFAPLRANARFQQVVHGLGLRN
ncbi:MAG: winged helix-turn-helix domain-containing protein [Acidobacteriota bacterium]